jgi:hypothetical protein
VIRKTRGGAKAAPSSSDTAAELPEVSVSDDGDVRHLHLGTPWIQGSMRIREPFEIELEYVQRMMGWLLFMEPASVAGRHAMQLGLGAAAITKFCHKKLRMRTSAIELNPQVLAVCRSWFKLPPDSDTLRVVLADAAQEIRKSEWQGNLFGRTSSYERSLARMAEAFGEEAMWAFRPTREGNTVVLAQRTPCALDPAQLQAASDQVQARWDLPTLRWPKIFVRPW